MTSQSSRFFHPPKRLKHDLPEERGHRLDGEHFQGAPCRHRSPSPSSESENSAYTSKENEGRFEESSNDDEVKEISLSDLKEGWDGWPQGNFLLKLLWEEFWNETEQLAVEWGYNGGGGAQPQGASEDADDPQLGK
ncbi:hypothetical protein Moror_11897 [Moniliophthora roreri MCA 2997]|uniref:Uncharacterized protein n=1 Tax=Moniliophthora roreri (strain MCA 2997) TaxID=1381753 RepID=V2X2Z5_MONRO|nr:hypothetical protein Moror_11897 [Moniliophthora roreri MCA 2997]